MRRRDFITELRTGGLVIVSDPFFNSRIGQLAGVTLEHSVPAIYQIGSNLIDPFQSAGVYAGRILNARRLSTCQSNNRRKLTC
jgi:hypothetical protein